MNPPIDTIFPKPSGGFMTIAVDPGQSDEQASIAFEFYDDLGERLYRYTPSEE